MGTDASRRGQARARAARPRARSVERPRSRTSTAPTCCTGWAVPLRALEHCRLRSRSSPRRSLWQRVGSAVRPAQGRHLRLALTLLPAPARLGGRARGLELALELAEGLGDAGRSPTRTSRPRSWQSDRATGSWRARTRSARRTSTSAGRQAQLRPADEQHRRAQLPSRQRRGGGAVPQGRVPRRSRQRRRGRRRLRDQLARARASRDRRAGAGGRASTQSPGAARRPRRTISTRSATQSSL